MSNKPSQRAREQVGLRSHHTCERCLVPAPQGHLHHRRSRSVRGQHCHCPCNMVWLCPTCHADVHATPFQAVKDGWIVSRHIIEPTAIAVRSTFEERVLFCTGGFSTRAVQSN